MKNQNNEVKLKMKQDSELKLRVKLEENKKQMEET